MDAIKKHMGRIFLDSYYESKGVSMENILVGDIMTEHVITVKTTCDIKTLSHLFLRYRISGVPVVDSKGAIVGVVTMNDLMGSIYERIPEDGNGIHCIFKELEGQKVRKIMQKNFITATKRTPIVKLFRDAIECDLMTVPVLQKGKLIGIVGLRDFLNIGLNI